MTGRGAYKPRRKVSVPKTLGQRITAIRLAFAMSQGAFAEACGASQQSLGLWETDKSKPSRPGLVALCRLTGLPESALLDGDGFAIPDELPGLVSILGSASFSYTRSEAVMATEPGNPKPIPLPEAEAGEVWRVDAAGGDVRPMSPEDAAELVRQASEHGDVVWVVVRRKAGKGLPRVRKSAPKRKA